MIISVSATKFNAVSVCKGVIDVRFYINHVYLAPNGDMVATDGHKMCLARESFSAEGFEGMIVNPQGKLPAKAETLQFDTETKMVTALSKYEEVLSVTSFEVIDHRYPDYYRVYNMYNKIKATEQIGLNYEYLAAIKSVFKSCKQPGVRLTFNGAEAVTVRHNQLPDVTLLIMACRL